MNSFYDAIKVFIIFIVSPPALCKGGDQDFKRSMLMGGGEDFFEILVGEAKRGDSIFCGSSLGGGLVKVGQFFLNQLQT